MMSETPKHLKVKIGKANYLGWRGELLAKLTLSWIPDLTIDEALDDSYNDFYVKTKDGIHFFVDVKAFSSLAMDAKDVDKVKELQLQASSRLVARSQNSNIPTILFLFDADTDHGRFLRLDKLLQGNEGSHSWTFKFPIENTINKTSLNQLIDSLRIETSYKFDGYPFTVLLTRRAKSPKPIEARHRVRKPTIEEWVQWGQEIDNSKRYLSPTEIEEEFRLDEEVKEITSAYQTSYSEWDASKSLYDKIILEIAGYSLSKEDRHSAKEFRKPTPEMLGKLWAEHKELVIARLYKCFCSLEQDSVATIGSSEMRVNQELPPDSTPFIVTHVLRKPTDEVINSFRSNVVVEQIQHDDPNIIKLTLHLTAAIELYDGLILNIERATVNGQSYSEKNRDAFVIEINPVYKLRVLEALLNVKIWDFKVDEINLPVQPR
jgi:hypothetical protein